MPLLQTEWLAWTGDRILATELQRRPIRVGWGATFRQSLSLLEERQEKMVSVLLDVGVSTGDA